MSRNFKIDTRHDHGSVRLRLSGDFDGSSACELLNAIEDCKETALRVLVDTGGLKEVHDFGRAVFERGSSLTTRSSAEIVLVGDKLTL